MNPIVNIINRIIYTINGLIGRIDKQTAMMIRQLFSLLIVMLAIGGIVMGWRMGKDAARIKSDPIASNTAELFDIDMRKERDEGSFGAMLESELIRESREYGLEKPRFRAKEDLEPDLDRGIIEPETDKKMKITGPDRDNPLFEGKYRSFDGESPEVKPLEKREKTIRGEDETRSEKTVTPLKKTEPLELPDSLRVAPEQTENRKGIIRDIRDAEPEPMNNSSEIIID